MDPLEIQYDALTSVPEAFRGLYEEKDGKAVLTKVSGLKTQKDIDNLNEALRKERLDHKSVKDQLTPWASLGKKPEEILAQLDRISELEAAADGKIDDKKINEMVEARLGQKVGPIERSLKDTTAQLAVVSAERDEFRNQLYRRDMSDIVRGIATEMKVVSTAIPDVEMFAQTALERQEDGRFITKAGIPGVTPGLEAAGLMREMQKLRPHWWPASSGGGAGDFGFKGINGDKNPWAKDSWNLTAQGQVVRQHGQAKAEEMAKAAGTYFGATKPGQKK
jgi:hypothetical protein